MEFRSNIIFSLVAHAMIFIAALALAGKGSALRLPERFTTVTLFEQFIDQKPAVTGAEKKKEPAVKTGRPVARLREASPPEVPLTARRQVKEPSAPVTPKNNSDEGVAGKAEPSPFVQRGAAPLGQTGGIPVTSPGAIHLSLPGKAATQSGMEGGKNRTTGPDAVSAIRASIEKAKRYPPFARKRGIEGTVTAEFTINSKGHPENIRIVRSSGYDILDTAARDTILRASPFPAVNSGIEVPITFRIEK